MRKLLFLLAFLVSLPVFGQKVLTNNGVVLTNNGVVLTTSAFNVEYQAVYDAYTVKPDAATAAIWNTYVESGVADGWWAKLDVLYVYAAHTNDNGEALINWINPGTFDATAVHAPAFEINTGFTGDGANDYINWNWNPSTDGINFVQDDASIGVYCRLNIEEDGIAAGLFDGPDGAYIYPRYASISDRILSKLNDNTFSQIVNTDSRGLFISTRDNSAHKDVYKNKVKTEQIETSSGIPNGDSYSLAGNNVGTGAAEFSTNQISMAFAGGSFTQTDVDNKTDAFNVAMDALGSGIIASIPFDNGKCIFSFDNGNESIITNAAPIFDGLGIKLTVYINGDLVDVNDGLGVHNMDWTQINSLNTGGHDIQCHGYEHIAPALQSSAELEANLNSNDTAFIAHGLSSPTEIGYPGNELVSEGRIAIINDYRNSGRVFTNVNYPFEHTWRDSYKYTLRTINIDKDNATAVQDAKDAIDYCVANKCAVIFTAHDVNDSGGTFSITINDLTTIVNYANASGIDIITHSGLVVLMI